MGNLNCSTPHRRRGCFAAGSAVMASLLMAVASPASAQLAYGMAWVFDGPGCRQGPAASPAGACADDTLVASLLKWMVGASGTTGPVPTPHVHTVTQAELASRLCPRSAADCEGIMAAYEAHSGTILLRDFLDMRRAPDRSFLVHELVHVLQHQREGEGFQARCSEVVKSEREAYQLQNRYLSAMGQPQRVGQMMALMACPREDAEPVLRGAARLPVD